MSQLIRGYPNFVRLFVLIFGTKTFKSQPPPLLFSPPPLPTLQVVHCSHISKTNKVVGINICFLSNNIIYQLLLPVYIFLAIFFMPQYLYTLRKQLLLIRKIYFSPKHHFNLKIWWKILHFVNYGLTIWLWNKIQQCPNYINFCVESACVMPCNAEWTPGRQHVSRLTLPTLLSYSW